MSAIWGFVNLDKTQSLPSNVQKIYENTYKANCKIDSYHSVTSQGAYLGCGIQFITEEAALETMPIINHDRKIIFTADCILDNREEVIQLLSSWHHSSTLQDTPDGTLMYLTYLQYGASCAKYFRGLFSIAIWDWNTQTLTFISDKLASRCLYYIRRGSQIAFSTLLEPLLAIFPDIKPNPDYYKDFLLANPSVIYVVPGETPYQEISLMLPASCVHFTPATTSQSAYWSLPKPSHTKSTSPKQYQREFMELYQDCVNDTLRTSGEIGIAMSSGLDSSSIGVLAAKTLADRNLSLYAYTFTPHSTLPQSSNSRLIFDESALVKEISLMYPNIVTTTLTNEGKNYFDDLELCCRILEMPYKTGAFSNHYEMCQHAARNNCKVFLNGGYGNNTVSYGYIQHILYHLYCRKKYITFILWLTAYAKHENINPLKLLYRSIRSFHKCNKASVTPNKPFIPANIFLSQKILKNYNLEKRFQHDRDTTFFASYIKGCDYKDYLYSPNLLIYLGIYETKFGLRTGMLLRDPTKDIRMIEFCNRLPYEMFAYHGTPRWLIRDSFQNILPPSILNHWNQHAVLNADWIERIRRDWTRLKPELLSRISSFESIFPELAEAIAKERLITAIEAFGSDSYANEKSIVHICAIDAILRFISSKTDN